MWLFMKSHMLSGSWPIRGHTFEIPTVSPTPHEMPMASQMWGPAIPVQLLVAAFKMSLSLLPKVQCKGTNSVPENALSQL